MKVRFSHEQIFFNVNNIRGVGSIRANYAKAESNVDRIEKDLIKHRDVLGQDISMYQQMYELNVQYYKELTMYIIAGKKALDHAKETKLTQLKSIAENSDKQEDVQAYRDYEDLCHRFEKKLSDLEITRVISIQSAPQVRMLQNNDREMMDKLQSSLANTIPLWRNQLVLSLGIEHTSRALAAQGALADKTNELLKKNSETLKMATVETAKQSERPIVDIDTLKQCNRDLIASINEVVKIHEQGAAQRVKAQEELVKIASFTGFKEGEIPLTFILVAAIFIGQQVYEGIAVQNDISNMAHIVGGIVGAVIGYVLNKK